MKTLLIVILCLFIGWSLWGYFFSRVEQAEYTVIKKYKDFEIRQYSSRIVAETTISNSDFKKSINSGFSIVAGYIFGDNIKQEKIAMTAPVMEKSLESEKIAMTAPVVVDDNKELRTISFVMPKKYTIETLPIPKDSRVKLREIPEQKIAVLRFSWSRNENRVEAMKDKLIDILQKENIEIIGSPSYAGYNAPGTPPWMIRNEILVEIK